MIYLLALFGLAYAQQKKQCLANVLAGIPGKVFEACDDISKVNALEADIRACRVQLGNCDGGGEENSKHGTGGSAQAVIVSLGAKNFVFSFTAQNPVAGGFKKIHDKALVEFEMDEDHDLIFDYVVGAQKVAGQVKDDQDLEEAVNLAAAMNVVLTLTAHRSTLSPTPSPTEPWGSIRYVKQVYGNIADGRDNGQANGRTTKFQKKDKDTLMRLHYEDNLRAYAHGTNCYWEMYIAGKRCPTGFIRGAMHSNGNQNNDHQTSTILGLCGNLATGEHVWSVHIYGNNRDCYTGWDPESKGIFLMESKEVKNGMYGYYGLTDRSKVRGEDNMLPITGRTLTFVKKSPASATTIRLVYADNWRVYGGGSCRWYLRIDDKICQGNKYLAQSVHTNGGDNDHLNQAFTGYCHGLAAGNHHVDAGVNGSNDCYTGWEGSFHLEAEEVPVPNDNNRRYVFQRHGNNSDGRDNGYINWRILNFKKAEDATIMRMTYADNLRVHGHGKWCKWEIRVNDKACGSIPSGKKLGTGGGNLSGNRHCNVNQNDHTPGQIVGYCMGLMKGSYTMKISVKGNGADCYTGWDRQSQGFFMMEAVEMDQSILIGVTNYN